MTDQIDRGAHRIAWVGAQVTSRERVPGAGTWEVVDHGGCDGLGALRALAGGSEAPPCPSCGRHVRWQLSHLAPSVAADHRGAGRLP
ncbi:MAG TPA: hypothetical protein VFZ79_09210 [Acidimicrobiales bacterium]